MKEDVPMNSTTTTLPPPTAADYANLKHLFFCSIEERLTPLFGEFTLDAFDQLDSNNNSYYSRYFSVLHTFVDDMMTLRTDMLDQ